MIIPKTKFIDVSFIKEVTPIQANVDEELIVPFIYISQDVHFMQVLGESFMNHLKTAGANETLTDIEKELLQNFVIYPLAFWTYYEALPSIRTKITNAGTQIENKEFSQSADLEDLKYTRADIRNIAEYYTSILINHLCNNSHLYPLFKNPDSDENVKASGKSFFNGVYLKKR